MNPLISATSVIAVGLATELASIPMGRKSDNTMLFPMLVFVLFSLFIGTIGIPFNPFNQEESKLDILSKLLTPSFNLLHENEQNSVNFYEFLTNTTFSISIIFVGILIASSFYKLCYLSLQNLNFFNSSAKKGLNKIHSDKLINEIYNWSYNRGYIDSFYAISFINGLKKLVEFFYLFDKQIIDGIINGVGVTSFFVRESIKYVGSGRISSFLLLYLFYAIIFLLIYYFFSFQ